MPKRKEFVNYITFEVDNWEAGCYFSGYSNANLLGMGSRQELMINAKVVEADIKEFPLGTAVEFTVGIGAEGQSNDGKADIGRMYIEKGSVSGGCRVSETCLANMLTLITSGRAKYLALIITDFVKRYATIKAMGLITTDDIFLAGKD